MEQTGGQGLHGFTVSIKDDHVTVLSRDHASRRSRPDKEKAEDD